MILERSKSAERTETERSIDGHDRALFRKAMQKEWETNLAAGAIEVIQPNEAAKIRQTQAHRIMQSRLLHVAKPIDDLDNFDKTEASTMIGKTNQEKQNQGGLFVVTRIRMFFRLKQPRQSSQEIPCSLVFN